MPHDGNLERVIDLNQVIGLWRQSVLWSCSFSLFKFAILADDHTKIGNVNLRFKSPICFFSSECGSELYHYFATEWSYDNTDWKKNRSTTFVPLQTTRTHAFYADVFWLMRRRSDNVVAAISCAYVCVCAPCPYAGWLNVFAVFARSRYNTTSAYMWTANIPEKDKRDIRETGMRINIGARAERERVRADMMIINGSIKAQGLCDSAHLVRRRKQPVHARNPIGPAESAKPASQPARRGQWQRSWWSSSIVFISDNTRIREIEKRLTRTENTRKPPHPQISDGLDQRGEPATWANH